jgi:phosphoribosylaminoimidazolecarboxamide formyltransferase/IMP cyclohydrolase
MESQSQITKNYALMSVSDKSGLESIARALEEMGFSLLATGGTYQTLKNQGFHVLEVSELTHEPERFGGRLKTLHHKILGGILFRPGLDESEWPYDFRIGAVVCNFYPFENKSRELHSLESVREWIDIGGPNMVRSAAKNYQYVWVLTKPSQYSRFIANPKMSDTYRERLAAEAFDEVALYDQVISDEFTHKLISSQIWSLDSQGDELIEKSLDSNPPKNSRIKTSELRYGENPQQKARFYPNKKLGLKLLGDWSYNNVRDADAALRFVRVFGEQKSVAVIKHQTLCGAALGLEKTTQGDSVFFEAWEADPVSRYGGVVGLNFFPSEEVLEILATKFVEVVLLPKTPESENWARVVVPTRSRLKVALVNESDLSAQSISEQEIWNSTFGKLIQQADVPSFLGQKLRDLSDFGEWTASCVKSNAITLVGAKGDIAVLAGAGGGQPNRIDSLEKLAIPRAQEFCLRRGLSLENLLCVSDAFLPFDDVLKVLAKNRIKKIIQPGGSKNDEQNANTARELGIEMTIRPPRHFWH